MRDLTDNTHFNEQVVQQIACHIPHQNALMGPQPGGPMQQGGQRHNSGFAGARRSS